MALVPAGAIGRRRNILCVLAASAIRWAAAVSDCSAMAARCTTVNSVVTVISSERDVIIVKTLGLRLWDLVSAAPVSGRRRRAYCRSSRPLSTRTSSVDRFPPSLVLPLAQIDFAGYCDLSFDQILREFPATFAEHGAFWPDRGFLCRRNLHRRPARIRVLAIRSINAGFLSRAQASPVTHQTFKLMANLLTMRHGEPASTALPPSTIGCDAA